MSDTLFAIPVLTIVIALLLSLATRRKRQALQMPAGEVIYQDTEEAGTTLYSHRHRLKGRPDFLLKHGDLIIPVEAKTGKTPNQPYQGHVMQLIAYCVLVEEAYGARPPHGIVRYPGRQFEIAFTAERQSELLKIIAEMRAKKSLYELHRSHRSSARCSACGVRQECGEQLDEQTALHFDS